ncbi:MAG: phosphoribosylamine--glycine ligase, partial [Candidatus Promineifilaceae bacterium]
MERLKVLIIGSGGREHALTCKIGQSSKVVEIFVAPGNAGTAVSAQNIAISDSDIDELLNFAQEKQIDLTVVGPEVPLALGIVDRFQAAGLSIFGPTQAAAQLEASKAFAKEFMHKLGIPTAVSHTVTNFEDAVETLHRNVSPNGIVVKASGLAAGKG